MTGRWIAALVFLGLGVIGRAAAEPMFLNRQYSRCTNCHYSPTGGGVLTPYGRSLSREELSTFGSSGGSADRSREHEFLFGLLGDALGPVSTWIALRPAHLDVDAPGRRTSRDFLMNAEIAAAFQKNEWTLYAQVGRQPVGSDERVESFEHWVSYKAASGLGVRAGRFFPAYGIRFSDHTAFTRSSLALDTTHQVYAVEMSYTGNRHLFQASVGPGFADDVGDSEERAFTATGRWQFDLRPKVVLVGSGLYRASSEVTPSNGAVGLAVGAAPTKRLTLWTQADARFSEGSDGPPGYTVLGEADFEAFRGVWLRVSPQLLTQVGDTSAGTYRLNLGLNLLPRTHWNVELSFYRDKIRGTDTSVKSYLIQLHFYL
jgi:hypothetical protein